MVQFSSNFISVLPFKITCWKSQKLSIWFSQSCQLSHFPNHFQKWRRQNKKSLHRSLIKNKCKSYLKNIHSSTLTWALKILPSSDGITKRSAHRYHWLCSPGSVHSRWGKVPKPSFPSLSAALRRKSIFFFPHSFFFFFFLLYFLHRWISVIYSRFHIKYIVDFVTIFCSLIKKNSEFRKNIGWVSNNIVDFVKITCWKNGDDVYNWSCCSQRTWNEESRCFSGDMVPKIVECMWLSIMLSIMEMCYDNIIISIFLNHKIRVKDGINC